jgi:hypothetical protein
LPQKDFWKMLQMQDVEKSRGEHLVISVRGLERSRAQTGVLQREVNYVFIINKEDSTTVYQRSIYPSIQMLSSRLFIDIDRKTISNTPYPGRGLDATRKRFESLPSLLPLENRDQVPVGLHGGYLILLDTRGGILTKVIPEGYHWFPSRDAFPESRPNQSVSQ